MTRNHTLRLALLLLLALVSPASPQRPWTRVPPLPTACYTKGERFHDENERVQAELEAAIYNQEATNSALEAKLAALDASTRESRMTAFTAKDPVAAQKYLHDAAYTGNQQPESQRLAERRRALEQRLKAVQADYVIAAAPLTSLYKAYQDATGPGSRVSHAKKRELASTYDEAYEKFCAKWWVVTSPFVVYLGELKQLLTAVAIPFGESVSRTKKTQFDIMAIPSGGFRSTTEMQAVKEYLEAARRIYQQRPTTPLTSGSERPGAGHQQSPTTRSEE